MLVKVISRYIYTENNIKKSNLKTMNNMILIYSNLNSKLNIFNANMQKNIVQWAFLVLHNRMHASMYSVQCTNVHECNKIIYYYI